MAAYVITDKIVGPDSLVNVLAAAETYIETLDSTNNPLYLVQLVEDGHDLFRLAILHG